MHPYAQIIKTINHKSGSKLELVECFEDAKALHHQELECKLYIIKKV